MRPRCPHLQGPHFRLPNPAWSWKKYLSRQTLPAELSTWAQQVSKYQRSFRQVPKYNGGVSSFKTAFSILFPRKEIFSSCMRKVGNPSVKTEMTPCLQDTTAQGWGETSDRSVGSPQNPATGKHVWQFLFWTQSSVPDRECWKWSTPVVFLPPASHQLWDRNTKLHTSASALQKQESVRTCAQNLTQIRCVETRQPLTKPGSRKCPINLGYYYFCVQGSVEKEFSDGP